ncbi:MAG: acyl-CoA dehydrogenase [Alphaproteobacteria bacterium]|nr:acyl-CoA dehydrogenase [Alphaproteobacteria bacterium]
MDFDLSNEQQQFRDSVRRFSEERLRAGALARARDPGYPWDIAKLMAAQGLLGIAMRVEDGGQGGTLMDALIAIQEVSGVCPRSADVIQAGNFGPARTLAEYGSPVQKQKYLAPVLRGEGLIAIGMTEPEAGSALTDLRTTATAAPGGYRVNGGKVFTTHSMQATALLCYCRFGPGTDGIGSVMIDLKAAGVSFGKTSRFMTGENWRQIYLENVFVPEADVVLKEGGFRKQMAGFNAERIGNSARSVAFGRLAFAIARDHAQTRKQFGRPLADFQGVQWKFAEMAMKLEAAQLMLYKAAAAAEQGLPDAIDTAMAKHMCNQYGFDVCNEAMQVMGGMGFSEETLVDYCMRRTRGMMIAGGSLEMMKNRIAEGVFGRRFSQRPPRPGASD